MRTPGDGRRPPGRQPALVEQIYNCNRPTGERSASPVELRFSQYSPLCIDSLNGLDLSVSGKVDDEERKPPVDHLFRPSRQRFNGLTPFERNPYSCRFVRDQPKDEQPVTMDFGVRIDSGVLRNEEVPRLADPGPVIETQFDGLLAFVLEGGHSPLPSSRRSPLRHNIRSVRKGR
jgi:hypothetical protein